MLLIVLWIMCLILLLFIFGCSVFFFSGCLFNGVIGRWINILCLLLCVLVVIFLVCGELGNIVMEIVEGIVSIWFLLCGWYLKLLMMMVSLLVSMGEESVNRVVNVRMLWWNGNKIYFFNYGCGLIVWFWWWILK